MSKEQLISEILSAAVATVPDLPTRDVENQEIDPPETGLWVEQAQLPLPEDSLGKAATDSDENRGVLQLSIFDADTGGGSKAAFVLADKIKNVFKHGAQFIGSGLGVFIMSSSRNNGRQSGGFFQVDVSISYRAFVPR